jgi:hypothetical protein
MRRVSVGGVAVRLRRHLRLCTTTRINACIVGRVGQRASVLKSGIAAWSRLKRSIVGCSRLGPSTAKGEDNAIRTS